MNSKKKIAFIGPNHLHVPLIKSLVQEYEIILYPDWPIDEKLKEGIDIIFLRFLFVDFTHFINRKLGLELSPPKYFRRLITSLRKVRPEIIVVMDYYNLYFWQVLFFRLFAPTVKVILYSETKMYPRGIFPRSILYLFSRILVSMQKFIDGVFVYSEMGSDFFRSAGIITDKIHILPIPANTMLFSPLLKKQFLEGWILRILMVARFVGYKNHDLLLRALSELKTDGWDRFHLTLAGSGGYLRDILFEKSLKLLGNSFVTFLPKISYDHMSTLYTGYDILVLPSFNEAVWMVVPEANASWIPAVVGPTVGASHYILDGQTGFILPSLEVSDIKRVLMQCHDPVLLEQLGRAARMRMETAFSEKVIHDRFMTYIRDL